MSDNDDWLAERFEGHRGHLRAVAYRMLGSLGEADDAVQETWLRLGRTDAGSVENLGGWLTTAVARVCLDMLRTRKFRREASLDTHVASPSPALSHADGHDPEQEALLADSVGLAMLVVLETLAPAERLAFVLHDVFAVPFEEIAPIVERSPAAARQLASRARRRVRGATTDAAADPATDLARQRTVVDAFLAAAREGDFGALLAVLDPDVVLRADRAAVDAAAASVDRGAPILLAELRGARSVAQAFAGRAQGAQPALVDGAVGAVWAPGGRPRAVFGISIAHGRIVAIDLVSDPDHLRRLDVTILDAGGAGDTGGAGT